MPHPSAILRLVGFAVAAGLAMAAVQPVLAATAGAVHIRWALGLTAPGLIVAGLVFGVARMSDRGDGVQPPWYSAWLLLPRSFLLAGAAAMCIFVALLDFALIPLTVLVPLIIGGLPGMAGSVLGRRRSTQRA